MLNEAIKMIPIYVMGKRYDVPQGLTILKALEFAGYQIVRGCGCRGGVCGACVTVFRKKGNYKLVMGLACQTVVEPHMTLVQLPYTPANKVPYSMEDIHADDSSILQIYPELSRCMSCNTCTKACPMELEVMEYVAAAIRGDLKRVVDLSIECVMCGMCAARCPAEISPFNVALLIRRIYGRCLLPPSHQLEQRLREIKEGRYGVELGILKKSGLEDLKERFKEFQATKGEAV